MRGSQPLLAQFVELLLHVVSRQLQLCGDAAAVGQGRRGQVLPRSMHVTHDGGGQAFVWSYLNPSSAQTAREAGKSSLARLI